MCLFATGNSGEQNQILIKDTLDLKKKKKTKQPTVLIHTYAIIMFMVGGNWLVADLKTLLWNHRQGFLMERAEHRISCVNNNM